MKKWKLIFLAALAGWPVLSEGISRVGNGGVKSEAYGYQLKVPVDFMDMQFFANENARFSSVKPSFFGSSLRSIDLRNFVTEFPNLKGLGKSELESHLLSNGWLIESGAKGCGSFYSQETETTVARIRVWGVSKGYVLVAEKTATTPSYLDSIAYSTVWDPGACQW